MVCMIMFRYIKRYILQDQSRSGALTGGWVSSVSAVVVVKSQKPSHEESDLTRRRLWNDQNKCRELKIKSPPARPGFPYAAKLDSTMRRSNKMLFSDARRR